MTRAGSTEVLGPCLLVWTPPDSCLPGISSTHLKKRPSTANDMPNRKKPWADKVRPSAATEACSVKKRPAAADNVPKVKICISAASDIRQGQQSLHAKTETRKVRKRPSASSSVPSAAIALR